MASLKDQISLRSVKRRITGTDPWLQAAGVSSSQYDDEAIREVMPSAIREFERDAQIALSPVRVVMADNDQKYSKKLPNGVSEATGEYADYVPNGTRLIEETPLSYFSRDALEYLSKTMPIRPIRQMLRMRVTLSADTPLQTFPNNWLQVDKKAGRVHIQAVTGTVETSGAANAYAMMLLAFGRRDYIPQCLAYDYDAGLPDDWYEDDYYADVRRALEESIAINVLEDISETFGAGTVGRQLSGGGFSQSETFTRFATRIAQLKESREKVIDLWRGQESPILMEVC